MTIDVNLFISNLNADANDTFMVLIDQFIIINSSIT